MRFNIKKIINMEKYNDLSKPLRKHKYLFIFLMLLVPLLHFSIFYVAVNINSILMAFQSFRGYDSSHNEIVAYSFDNFLRLFRDLAAADSEIRPALSNTLLFFSESIFVVLPITYVVSYFFYKRLAGSKVFTVVIFLPSIVSAIVITTVFQNIIAPNGLLGELWPADREIPMLLSNPKTAKWVILFYCFWTGLSANLLLMIGALNRIPNEVIEAAVLDGANAAVELVRIITPMMWPTLSTMLVLNVAGVFTASGPILLFTKGSYDTMTVSYWIFDQVQYNASFYYPSAVGLFFTLLGLPIVFAARKIFGRIYADVEY